MTNDHVHGALMVIGMTMLAAPCLPAAPAVPSRGLVSRWTFDGDPLGRDASGGGHDAAVRGRASRRPGVTGDSLCFLSREGHLEVADAPELSFANATFSVALWVNAYWPGEGQQMLVGKNVYARDWREWSLFVDDDGMLRLYLRRNGRWCTVAARTAPRAGEWLHVAATVERGHARLFVNGVQEGEAEHGAPLVDTPAPLTLGGLLNGGRPMQRFCGALDDVCVFDRALSAEEVRAMVVDVEGTHPVPERPAPYALWDPAVPFPELDRIPLPDVVTHVMVHRATMGEYQFLHGAAVVHVGDTLFASWANSPVQENSSGEVQRGRRSTDGGLTWSDVEVIAPGFEGVERHSHGVFAIHQGRLWAFAARFGAGEGNTFPGLCAEAFVLGADGRTWDPQGTVMRDCWPYDEPKRLADGNWITGGQDRNQYPVVAISHGGDFLHWDSVKIPVPEGIPISFGETTVLPEPDGSVLAIIRPSGTRTALVSTSVDCGRTWTPARYSNFPMTGSKPYALVLSTGQRCLMSNWPNRNTLTVAVSRPGEARFCRVWRLRHGPCPEPCGEGRCARVQWSYPYAHEHDGKLYVVYSVGKEDAALSIVPLTALTVD